MNKITPEKSNISFKSGLILVLVILVCFFLLFGRDSIFHRTVNIKFSNTSITLNSDVFQSNQPCTFGLLKRFFDKSGYFPGSGKWHLNESNPYFRPDACRLKYKRFPAHEIAKCISKAGIHSIKTIGDSNGGRYGAALASSIGKCRKLKAEKLKEGGFLPDISYFQNKSEVWSRFLTARFRFCKGCASSLLSCQVGKNKTVLVEHLAMTMILYDSLKIQVPRHENGIKTLSALTSQEFYFKYYLKNAYPDIFLIFLPFNHVKHHSNDTVAPELETFRILLQSYAPDKTKIFFMPTFAESEKKRRNNQWINATFHNQLATNRIDTLNHMMNEIMKKDILANNGRTYGFFDLLNISRPVHSWSLDGVHMNSTWYQIVMSMFWETLYNSVNMDDF